MLDDADEDGPAFDPPDTDSVYARYLETCRRVGVEPMPRDRAQDLMPELSDAIAVGRSVPPSNRIPIVIPAEKHITRQHLAWITS